MSALQKIISLILVICFIGLVYLFFKTYQDTEDANNYIEFVTTSANEVITEVDEVNTLLNSIQYSEESPYEDELKAGLNAFGSKLDSVKRDNSSYEIPYKGDAIDKSFSEFLQKGDALKSSLEEIMTVVENLEGKDAFEAKVDIYIQASNSLQGTSTDLESVLNDYVQNYNNVDFNRIIDAATNF